MQGWVEMGSIPFHPSLTYPHHWTISSPLPLCLSNHTRFYSGIIDLAILTLELYILFLRLYFHLFLCPWSMRFVPLVNIVLVLRCTDFIWINLQLFPLQFLKLCIVMFGVLLPLLPYLALITMYFLLMITLVSLGCFCLSLKVKFCLCLSTSRTWLKLNIIPNLKF